jgi:succinate-semialdehyde dehydrogenase/glutarate-semialdehyde dehydrogenase
MKIDSYYGPMARLDLRDELHEQVQKQYNKEDVWFWRNNPEGKGAYYPASILVDLNLEWKPLTTNYLAP